METKNAKIINTTLGTENGILSFTLQLEGNGWGVGFGNYALDEYDTDLQKRIPTAQGFGAVARVLEVVGVDNWEDLKGNYIRVESAKPGKRITKIGNLITNEWLDLEEFFNK